MEGPVDPLVRLGCLVSGFWIAPLPFKGEKSPRRDGTARVLCTIYGIALNIVMTLVFVINVYSFTFVSTLSWMKIFQLTAYFIVYTNNIFYLKYLQFQNQRFNALLKEFNILLKTSIYYQHGPFSRIPCLLHCVIPLAFLIATEIFAVYNFFGWYSRASVISSTMGSQFFEEVRRILPINPFVYVTVFTILGTMFFTKRICLDSLYLGVVCAMAETLVRMRDELNPTVTAGPGRLDQWIRRQRALARVVAQLNDLMAPCIVITIGLNTCTICLSAFSTTKVLASLSFMWYLLGVCTVVLLQTFLYCHAGHRLKKAGDALSEAACRVPWLRAHPALVPGLQLIALDCRRSFVARGGPFFTLSLEFFASVVGAVLTYFVVLLQLKD